jgi:hypothetical protein
MTLDDFINRRWRFAPRLPDCLPEERQDPNDVWIDYDKEERLNEDDRRNEG